MATTVAANAARRMATASAPVKASRSFSSMLGTTEEFPGLPNTYPTPAKSSPVTVTSLPSLGLTVATESSSRSSTVLLHLPSGGSSSELAGEAGCAHVSKYMSFKSTTSKSSLATLRMMEDAGAVPIAKAGRTSAVIGYTAMPDMALDEELLDSLVAPCTNELWDLREAVKVAAYDKANAYSNPHSILSDKIYAAAFGEASALGRSFYADAGPAPDVIAGFRARAYGTNGGVLAATGVSDHAAFVAAVEGAFDGALKGEGASSSADVYVGGEQRVKADTPYSHLALAFKAPSDPVVAAVLKKCIGSSGAVTAFSSPELIGAYGFAESSEVSSLIDSLISSFKIDISQLDSAVAAAKGDALLDGSLADSIVAGIAADGSYDSAAVASAYDAVTAEKVKSAAAEAMASPLSLAAVGDLSGVPHIAEIAKSLSA